MSSKEDGRWAAQVAALEGVAAKKREPLSAGRIVAAALAVVAAEGYGALTVRRVVGALGATPGALYAHVRDKAELDDLMIGELCSRVVVPEPDAGRWLEQVTDVFGQLRDQYLAFPGIARASFDTTPHSLAAWRVHEGLLAILTAGGKQLREAAWTVDSAFLYTAAYCVVSARRVDGGDIVERFRALPAGHFPILSSRAEEIVSGSGHERFDATIKLMFGGLS